MKQYNKKEWEHECIAKEFSINGQIVDIEFDNFTNGAEVTQVEMHVIHKVNTCRSCRKEVGWEASAAYFCSKHLSDTKYLQA